MKRIVFFALVACLCGACTSNVNRDTNITSQAGGCGDVFELTPVKANMPARVKDEDTSLIEERYYYGDGLECVWMEENHLRIVYHIWSNCTAYKINGAASVKNNVITLKKHKRRVYMFASCNCDFPVCFDFTNLEYGVYTVKADYFEFTIDFQPNMLPVAEGNFEIIHHE